NNIIEGDHARLKRLIKPTLGFKSKKTAYATIKGFEVMRAIKKGQAVIGQIQKGVWGEIRMIERAFGIGKSAIAEAVDLINAEIVKNPDLEKEIMVMVNNMKAF
ncbi:MAG: DDE-type integrase/transposase/recombinase, partial [Alphaproteobacteria bacterium]